MSRPTGPAKRETFKPLPPEFWGEAQEKKKKEGAKGETTWYISMIERVAIAAWWLRKDPTHKHLNELDEALNYWNAVMGWDGTMNHRKEKECDETSVDDDSAV